MELISTGDEEEVFLCAPSFNGGMFAVMMGWLAKRYRVSCCSYMHLIILSPTSRVYNVYLRDEGVAVSVPISCLTLHPLGITGVGLWCTINMLRIISYAGAADIGDVGVAKTSQEARRNKKLIRSAN